MIKKKINFIENLDPTTLKNFFKNNKKNSLGLLIISKSGETLEVLCLLDILMNSFKNNFDLINNTLIISDKKHSTLRNIANKYSIDVLDHDKNIGGRFSCFSLTGLLPMYLAGINSIKLKELVDKSFKKNLLRKNNVNSIFITAVSQIMNKKEAGAKFSLLLKNNKIIKTNEPRLILYGSSHCDFGLSAKNFIFLQFIL